MKHFGIYSPVLGLRKDFPSVLLDKAFTPDAENIRYWHGEIQTAKLRRKMFMRQSFACSPSSDIIYVSGDITPSIPDGSDIVPVPKDYYYLVELNTEELIDQLSINWFAIGY